MVSFRQGNFSDEGLVPGFVVVLLVFVFSCFCFFFSLADNSCFIFRRKGKESFFELLFVFFKLPFKLKILFFRFEVPADALVLKSLVKRIIKILGLKRDEEKQKQASNDVRYDVLEVGIEGWEG